MRMSALFCFGFLKFSWLDWVFVAAHRLFSSCSEWGLLSPCSCGSFSCCRAWALGHVDSVFVAPRLSSCGPQASVAYVVLRHVGSSRIRDPTHISCTGSWILYHWAIREAQELGIGIEIISLLMPLLALLCSTVCWTLLSRSHMVYSNTFFKKSFTMKICPLFPVNIYS